MMSQQQLQMVEATFRYRKAVCLAWVGTIPEWDAFLGRLAATGRNESDLVALQRKIYASYQGNHSKQEWILATRTKLGFTGPGPIYTDAQRAGQEAMKLYSSDAVIAPVAMVSA